MPRRSPTPASPTVADIDLTDLEAVAVGCLLRRGPSTAYRVRRFFLESPSARFSGSAGAIYPSLRKLEEAGLLSSRKVDQGKRPGERVPGDPGGQGRPPALDPEGRPAGARTWRRTPLRTRMLHLGLLSTAERHAWIDAAEASLRAQNERIEAYAATSPGDPWAELASDNARSLNRARLRWLAKVRERVNEL